VSTGDGSTSSAQPRPVASSAPMMCERSWPHGRRSDVMGFEWHAFPWRLLLTSRAVSCCRSSSATRDDVLFGLIDAGRK
jgi:hypothetical protein